MCRTSFTVAGRMFPTDTGCRTKVDPFAEEEKAQYQAISMKFMH